MAASASFRCYACATVNPYNPEIYRSKYAEFTPAQKVVIECQNQICRKPNTVELPKKETK